MTAALAAAAVAVATGAALQSAVGFGFALVAAPLVFAATSPEEAVGLMVLLGAEVNLLTLAAERRRPRPLLRDVLVVLAWAPPGALAGVAVLRALDAVALQVLVTAGVLVTLVVNRRAARMRRGAGHAPPGWARPAAGLASGALNTSTTTGGPPLVLLLMGRGLPPDRVRDTLTATFLGLSAVSTVALALTGTEDAVPEPGTAALLVPLCAAGQLAGRPLFARLARGRRYETVLSAVLVATAAAGLLTVLA